MTWNNKEKKSDEVEKSTPAVKGRQDLRRQVRNDERQGREREWDERCLKEKTESGTYQEIVFSMLEGDLSGPITPIQFCFQSSHHVILTRNCENTTITKNRF